MGLSHCCERNMSLNLHSKRVEKMWNYTRNEWRRCETTLETSGEDGKLHSKRVYNLSCLAVCPASRACLMVIKFFKDFDIFRPKTTLETSGEDAKLHSKRVCFHREYASVPREENNWPTVCSHDRTETSRVWVGIFSTRFEFIFKFSPLVSSVFFTCLTLVSSVFLRFLHSFRVYFSPHSVRFHCRDGGTSGHSLLRVCPDYHLKLHSKRVEKMRKLHSKRVEKI